MRFTITSDTLRTGIECPVYPQLSRAILTCWGVNLTWRVHHWARLSFLPIGRLQNNRLGPGSWDSLFHTSCSLVATNYAKRVHLWIALLSISYSISPVCLVSRCVLFGRFLKIAFLLLTSSVFSSPNFYTMNSIKDGWFTETCTLWPGQAMSLQVEEVLYHQKSKFQDVMVFKRLVRFFMCCFHVI